MWEGVGGGDEVLDLVLPQASKSKGDQMNCKHFHLVDNLGAPQLSESGNFCQYSKSLLHTSWPRGEKRGMEHATDL